MENSFQTSFIPKKPIVTNGATTSYGGGQKTTSISMVVSVSILIVVILSTGGLFLYKNYLIKNKEALSSSLVKVRDSFDNDTIAELETYDKRSSTAKQILNNHIVLSPLFELINELTLSSIQYTKFDHNTANGIFSVKMSGIARDYRSIALQADVFNTGKGRKLKDIVFSNLTKDKNNYVTFDVEFTVDPSLLAYSNNLNNNSSPNPVINPNPSTSYQPGVDNSSGQINPNQPLTEPVNTTQ
jgi:hypothetical protein